MSLADYQPATQVIKVGRGGSFTVRGLSLSDVQILLASYYPDIEHLVDLYGSVSDDVFARGNTERFILELARRAPALVADAIALAADEPAMSERARQLPFPVQVDALKAIGKLTFEEVGGPKKFVASLLTLLGGVLPQGAMAALEMMLTEEAASIESTTDSGRT